MQETDWIAPSCPFPHARTLSPSPSPQVQREHHLPLGDFPDLQRFREILAAFDLSRFHKITSAMLKQVRADRSRRLR